MDTNQEKKDVNSLADANQNTEANSKNEEQSEQKKDVSSFDSEGTLDINLEEPIEKSPADEKQSKTIRTIVIAVLLLLPIVYIFYKTTGNSTPGVEQATNQTQKIDIASYENAAKSAPTYSNFLNLSNAYINSGMAAKAIDPLNKAIILNPTAAAAYNNLGFAYSILQQYKKGIEFGERAVQLDSTFQLAKNNLNWARTEQKKLFAAIETMEKTPENKRDNAFYMANGLLYLKVQDYDKSIEVWNKILVTDPKNEGALINLGVAYMSKFQYDEAVKTFKKAIDANSSDQLAKNNLAWALDEKSKADSLAQKSKVGALKK